MLQNDLLSESSALFFVISKTFLFKRLRRISSGSCEGAVSLISHVSFFPTSDIRRTAVVLCSLDQHFLREMKTLHF